MYFTSSRRIAVRTLTLLLSVLAFPQSTWADSAGSEKRPPRPPKDALLNVDFGGAEPWLGIAATGDAPSDYWNPYWAPYQLFGQLPDLLWSDGQLSGVSATVENAPGAWANDHPDGMMNTFIHSFGYQPITVTLANLPNGTYDVYVYAHGVLDQNSVISAQADGITYGPETINPDQGWQAPAWTEGAQFILLEGVSVTAGSPLVLYSSPGATDLAVLNGLQVRQTSQRSKRLKPAKVERPPQDALLNVDFAAPEAWVGMAATGDGATDYWNASYTPYQYFAELFDLKWSTGLLSGVTATVENAPGAWTNEHPDGMMNTFMHSFGFQPIIVTLTDLPNGTYDVYAYAHGVLDQNSMITAEADGVTYGPETSTTGAEWQSPTWTEGAQYILLQDVSVIAGSPLIIRSSPGATELAVLNGLQLRQTSQRVKKAKPAKVEKPSKDALLNVDFANTEPWFGMAATGNGSLDFWNRSYAPYQYFAELFDLKWSSGLLSGVSATVENAPGAWTNEHPDGMMNTFTHSFGYQPIIVTLTDLPAGTYNVYVYAHGVLDQNSIISAEVNGVTYAPEATTTGGDWQSPVWTEGSQYILLENVSVVSGSPLIIHSAPGATELATLNGLQLRRVSKK